MSRLKKLIDVDIKMKDKDLLDRSKSRNSLMSAFETFLTFSLASTCAVATLATWLRFTNPPSAKRN
jgi:hypothetical protein